MTEEYMEKLKDAIEVAPTAHAAEELKRQLKSLEAGSASSSTLTEGEPHA